MQIETIITTIGNMTCIIAVLTVGHTIILIMQRQSLNTIGLINMTGLLSLIHMDMKGCQTIIDMVMTIPIHKALYMLANMIYIDRNTD